MPDSATRNNDLDPFEPRNARLYKAVGRETLVMSVFIPGGLSGGASKTGSLEYVPNPNATLVQSGFIGKAQGGDFWCIPERWKRRALCKMADIPTSRSQHLTN